MRRSFIALRIFCQFVTLLGLTIPPAAWGGDTIPKAAWSRLLGLPLQNGGVALQSSGIDDGYWQGAPVGGIGAGTFSRSYRGDFARWHIKAAVHKYQPVYANQFAVFEKAEGDNTGYAQALLNGHPDHGELSSWRWDYPVGAGTYYALFPKSWFVYQASNLPARLTLEQFSPVLPNNYRESSYPVAVYRWHAENPTSKTVTVSVLLSWTNMTGWFRTFTRDFDGTPNTGNHNEHTSEDIPGVGKMQGIVFNRNRAAVHPNEWDGQMAIAVIDSPGVEVSYQTSYDASGDGEAVWEPFSQNGKLANSDKSWISEKEKLAGAIAVRFTLQPGEQKVIPMVIAWDFPVVQFGQGREWYRKYTDFYGTSGLNAWSIAREGLLHASEWSDAIDRWQAPYVNDESKPLWFRGMLFNELYALSDGGTFWGREVGSSTATPAKFALLECFDYAYYGTLDVRFYGSLPLLKFWPDIDKQVLREFAATVPREWPDEGLWVWKTQLSGLPITHKRKKLGAVPHDLGVPEGDPFYAINEPGWQDTNDWKDLNSKFVLMVYRDYVLTGSTDKEFLRETWPAVQAAIEYLRQFDHGGGVPENTGYPDQTYDDWVTRGVSAYCGGLWLAALRAGEETARILGETKDAERYHALFVKGQKTYISQLWNGEFFRYDTSEESRNDIQTDQLAGQWYAKLTGLGEIVPRQMQIAAAQKIFDFNVLKFGGGQLGAVNGMHADGTVVSNVEAREVWVGTTLGYAGLLISEGMKDEAWKTVSGLYHVIYESKGYWFRTPEAWDITGNFRAGMYMRPMGVWALEMTPEPK
ncbi:MAG TPA: non-lysosomal glucosylceramidase [Alloacidobacterium sp.]|nr:non-lysosomal glucosylceramidase [Alloacidobacterium sp.]